MLHRLPVSQKQRSLDADCSTGKKVIGGGFSVDDDRVVVMESLPKVDGSGWRVKAKGPRENWQLRAYAICSTATTDTTTE